MAERQLLLWPETYSTRCVVCGRKLRRKKSQTRGMGPRCESQFIRVRSQAHGRERHEIQHAEVD
jgi:hypothetical protein